MREMGLSLAVGEKRDENGGVGVNSLVRFVEFDGIDGCGCTYTCCSSELALICCLFEMSDNLEFADFIINCVAPGCVFRQFCCTGLIVAKVMVFDSIISL